MEKAVVKLLVKAIGCTVFASVYAGASLFFKDSFYPRTQLSDLNIGGKTVEVAQLALDQKGNQFEISVYGRGVNKEKLYGRDFELSYSIKEDLKDYKDNQNALAWPISLLKKNKLDVTEEVQFNEDLLEDAINNLSYFRESKVIEPVDAQIVFNGESYDIKPEVEGNKLNKEAVKKCIIEALNQSKRVVDLDEAGCYESPRFRADAKEFIEAKDLMNQYIQTEITYLFGSKEEKVAKEQMAAWLKVNDVGEVEIEESKVRAYVAELDRKYSTLGSTREFKSSEGKMATVSGGDYGFKISVTNETNAIMEALKSGESIRRTPKEISTSQGYKEKEIDKSYVEINLTKQYLWYYKDGKLTAQGSIVTGDQRRGYSTPQGVYKLDYKQRNATLNGPGYSTPVSFWMPFNRDIGIHDAVWRSQFGGTIYKANGSHGCVNVPYDLAKTIFATIDESMPIVCYY